MDPTRNSDGPELPPAPVEARSTAPRAVDPTDDDLMAAFDTALEPPGTTLLYRLGLLLVTLAMVLLPLIYLGLVGAIGYGVYYHATVNHTILSAPGGGGRGRVFAYVAPLLVGAVGVLFMVKPLFAPRAKRPPTHVLDPESHPLVFRFVERLCRTVGAPMPRRIDVDTEVNASASFRRGFASFLGNDLVLTIGMPLVEGMSLRQLTGVLAHEFGHFAQGSGMRLTYVVRSVNAWFARVVYERDAWDAQLEEAAARTGGWVWALVGLCRLFVWATRKILWALMWAGHLISSFALRQMEYDADRYEARVAGSETFEQTADRLVVLSVANQGAHADLQRAWQASQLADDLPALVLANVEELKEMGASAAASQGPGAEDVIGKILKSSREQSTGLFDTHPSNQDRINAAKALNAPGIFRIDAPASRLFADHKALSREVTLRYYREVLGLPVGPDQLVPSEALAAETADRVEGYRGLARYFQGRPPFGNGFRLFLPGDVPPAAADDEVPSAIAELTAAREHMLDSLPAIRDTFQAYLEADAKADEATATALLMEAGLRVPASGLKLNDKGLESAARSREQAQQIRDEALWRINEAAEPIRARLVAGLRLRQLSSPAEGAEPVDVGLVEFLAAVLGGLRDAWPSLNSVVEALQALGILVSNAAGQGENAKFFHEVQSQTQRLHDVLVAARQTLLATPYPFDHGGGPTSIGSHLVPVRPPVDLVGHVAQAAQEAIEKYQDIYVRVLSVLALQAEKIERNAGLPRLPEPEREEALAAQQEGVEAAPS